MQDKSQTNHTKLRTYSLLMLLGFLSLPTLGQMPFRNGVNLTNWFQSNSVTEIHFSKYTRQDFLNIKSLGCDVIRLPINLEYMTNGSPDYTFEPLFFELLDQAVGWANELGFHLILDNHTVYVEENTNPSIGPVLEKMWQQIAARYKNFPTHLYYEVMNEPHRIDNNLWYQIQLGVINTIRAEDAKHTIIVGATDWNSITELKKMPVYSDTNLIYTFHFYNPFLFTHQGTTTNELEDLGGVPFPYDSATMPECPLSFIGKWQEELYKSYPADGNIAKVKELLSIAANYRDSVGMTVYCGELGVLMDKCPPADRYFWYKTVTDFLRETNIPWTMWDYHGNFGLFEKDSHGLFEYDLDTALARSLGFYLPPQNDFSITAERNPVTIYSDYTGNRITPTNYLYGGTVNYYADLKPATGNYSIEWSNSGQYGGIRFDFYPNRDFSLLVASNFKLDLYIRGNRPGTKIQFRFVDSKANPLDHPWRMSFDADDNMVVWDGQWQHIQIPLGSFRETGAWDNGWFEPQGKFDWKNIDLLEIISEFHSLEGFSIGFDEININGEPIQSAENTPEMEIGQQIYAYPNPFSQSITIQIQNPDRGRIDAEIINAEGKLIKQFEGISTALPVVNLQWNGTDKNNYRVSPGIYIFRLITSNGVYSYKIAVK